MRLTKKRGLYEAGRVVYIPAGDISVNPSGSRRAADPGALRELSASILKYGILQPLTVRRLDGGGPADGTGNRKSNFDFELVTGERRLRAAKLAGLRDVPCIILDVGEEESAAIVLVENLQRRDLDFIEEARALDRLRELYGYSQDEIARLVGRSQPAVANKLRLLRLPPELLLAARDSGLTERHARALLRLPSERAMAEAVGRMIADDMNVAEAEEYVENVLGGGKKRETAALESAVSEAAGKADIAAPRAGEPVIIVRDHRFFVNTIERGAETMRRNGADVRLERRESEAELVLTVSIAKNRSGGYGK
ncbi:MAG: ParB/RepB/Spo0J family partition protein [Oscillospiraceae bacterium]|jgi:ParB family chromosome partitioning protein|nr:ParB/RepB/Spo0J family partition protein [Oscillospiraceae bacterium]